MPIERDSLNDTVLSGTALIVEDDFIIALDAEDMLLELGADNVHVAADVDSALALIEAGDIRFALLDVNLGDRTSQPVAERLRDLTIPFVVATGYRDFENAADTPAPILPKPYGLEPLRTAVQASQIPS